MRCEVVQEELSARLDGEPSTMPDADLDRHLRGCPDCRDFDARVPRLRPVPRADLVPALAGGAWPVERLLLLVLGTVQLLLSVPPLLGADLAASVHVTREVGVTDVALAVGLLAAAWQPWRAAGMLPVVGTLAGGLAAIAVLDVLAGRVSALGEAPHLLAPVSALLLYVLRRRVPPAPGGVPVHGGLHAVPDERRTA